MSENPHDTGPVTREGEPVPFEKRNGKRRKHKAHTNGARGEMPGLDIRTLIAERNWPALAGLALIAIGGLHIMQNIMSFGFNLWGLLLIGIGGWLGFTTWQEVEQADGIWTERTRNRALAGSIVALIGLMGIFDINWWGLMLMAVGGWLGYDTWQKYEAAGREMTPHLQNRAIISALIGALGFFGFFGLGSSWSVILIGIGVIMLFRHFGSR